MSAGRATGPHEPLCSLGDSVNPYEQLSPGVRRAIGVSSVLVVLVIWSLLAGLDLVSQAKLPAPWEVGAAFVQLGWDPARETSPLANAILASVGRLGAAAVLVVLTGIPVGVLMGASPRVNAALSPLIDPFRSAPIVAVLPILVMWLGIDERMKVAFLWLGAVVYLVPMVRDAMQAVPQVYYIKAKDLGATDVEAVLTSVLPMASPRIADAVTVAVSIQWTYITVAEYVNATSGIGKLISDSKRFSAMDQVFAEIATIIVLALVTYQTMVWGKRRLYAWETT